MGWLISIPLLIGGFIARNETIILASAIFAVSGSITTVATYVKDLVNIFKDKK